MIIGIGVDSVHVERFAHWHEYTQMQLLRVLHAIEIDYCKSTTALQSAQRFAVRFAAKEAFLKAVQSANPKVHYTLLAICKAVYVDKTTTGAPYMVVDWHTLGLDDNANELRVHLSLTHTQTNAVAFVVIEQLSSIQPTHC